jgi:hypothetical protein
MVARIMELSTLASGINHALELFRPDA